MKKLIAFFFIAAIAYAVFAASDLTLTVTLTPAQARGLTVATAEANAAILADNPKATPLTEAQFAAHKLADVLNFFAAKAKAADDAAILQKYQALKQPDKDAVDAVLK